MESTNVEQITATAGELLEATGTLAYDQVKLKLDAIDTIASAAYKCESVDVKDEIEALVGAVMFDLGLKWNQEEQAYEYSAIKDTFSDEL